MARGEPIDTETIYKIIASYAVTGKYSATARQLGIAASTVRDAVKKHNEEKEFAEVREHKKEEIADKCTEVIDMLLEAAKMKAQIMLKDKRTLNKTKLTEITTSFGTLYDKRALAQGESTSNIMCELPDEVKKYAQ